MNLTVTGYQISPKPEGAEGEPLRYAAIELQYSIVSGGDPIDSKHAVFPPPLQIMLSYGVNQKGQFWPLNSVTNIDEIIKNPQEECFDKTKRPREFLVTVNGIGSLLNSTDDAVYYEWVGPTISVSGEVIPEISQLRNKAVHIHKVGERTRRHTFLDDPLATVALQFPADFRGVDNFATEYRETPFYRYKHNLPDVEWTVTERDLRNTFMGDLRKGLYPGNRFIIAPMANQGLPNELSHYSLYQYSLGKDNKLNPHFIRKLA